MNFEKIAEDKIREAIERGEFDDLPGRGRPLQGLAAYFATPESVRVGYSVLKSSGFVPEEVGLLKEIELLKGRLENCFELSQKAKIQLEIRHLQLKYDLIIESYRKSRRAGQR
jgi:hypothetical protein